MIVACAMLVWSAVALADSKVSIYLTTSTPDAVGQRVVYALRESIARSNRYSLAYRDDDSLFQFRVVTLDPTSQNTGQSTVYSIVLTGSRIGEPSIKVYLDNIVGVCGGNRVESCANSIMSAADSTMTPLLEYILKSVQQNTKQ
jgi:hypothetical protein